MSRRSTREAVIVGGGVVGAACALALNDAGLSVALVEGREPARWHADQPDLRVYAFAADNAALLDSLGVWNAVRAARVQPYRRMRVWDAGGGGELGFDADTLGREQLGWIIENDVLVDRLWAAVHAAGIKCIARHAWSSWSRTLPACACAWTMAAGWKRQWPLPPMVQHPPCANSPGCRSPGMPTHSAAWSPSWKPNTRIRPPPGSAS